MAQCIAQAPLRLCSVAFKTATTSLQFARTYTTKSAVSQDTYPYATKQASASSTKHRISEGFYFYSSECIPSPVSKVCAESNTIADGVPRVPSAAAPAAPSSKHQGNRRPSADDHLMRRLMEDAERSRLAPKSPSSETKLSSLGDPLCLVSSVAACD